MKKQPIWCVVVVFVAILVFMWLLASSDTIEETTTQPTRAEKIQQQFSSRDWKHHNLTKIIKENMHNPKSFEHVDTMYRDFGDYLIVRTIFRWTNMLWWTITQEMYWQVDLEWNVIDFWVNAQNQRHEDIAKK